MKIYIFLDQTTRYVTYYVEKTLNCNSNSAPTIQFQKGSTAGNSTGAASNSVKRMEHSAGIKEVLSIIFAA
jgi:hypothetical protein